MTNKWKIEGYAGWSSFDGPEDYNIDKVIEVDEFITKEDILSALRSHYKNYRETAFKLTKL